MTDSTLTPSQEAREAAEDAYYTCFEQEPNRAWLDALLAGRHDDDPVTQAFARFEQSIRKDEAEKCAALADAKAVVWRNFTKMHLPVAPSPVINEDRAKTAEQISAAIRARAHPGEGA